MGLALLVARTMHISVRRLFGRADYARWSNPQNLERWWDARTERLARLIPANSRVLEFGAGRQQLQAYLPQGCTYLPSDLTSRGPDTIVCDLNQRPLPDLRGFDADVVVFGGVLEYMNDLPGLTAWLSQQTRIVVASYDYLKSRRGSTARMIELFRRNYFGYMSNCTLEDLIGEFARNDFQVVTLDDWESQKICVFAKAGSYRGQALAKADASVGV